MSEVMEGMDETPEQGEEVAPEILAEAREQGWVPREQWTGKDEEWSDAETFVRRGREINPILRKALKKERERTATLEAELRATGATVAELREYLQKVEERATKNALAQLKKARADALAAGDHGTAQEYEDQMDELKESKSAIPEAKKAPQQQTIHPEISAWMERNPWYAPENQEMVDYANSVAARLMQNKQAQGQTFTPGDILPDVTERVRKMFPSYFGRGEAPTMFEGGGSPSGSARAATSSGRSSNGFAKLPAEARAQFQRFYEAGYYVDFKSGKKLSEAEAQKEYLKEYDR